MIMNNIEYIPVIPKYMKDADALEVQKQIVIQSVRMLAQHTFALNLSAESKVNNGTILKETLEKLKGLSYGNLAD